jgi:hypothetical protein
MLDEHTNTIKKNTEALLDTNREVSPEANAEKNKYMVLSLHQTVRKNHNSLTANKFFENTEKFIYLGISVTNQSCIHKEIKRK